MSSSNKTANLHLNQWSGSDTPKRADFNYDNDIIESIITAHLNDDSVHFATDEKPGIVEPYVINTYVGSGANARVINLSFSPKLIFIFPHLLPFTAYNSSADKVYSYAGVATRTFRSPGILINGSDIELQYMPNTPTSANYHPMLNESGVKYTYIAFK